MSVAWKTVRVFISSTFRDMHAERDHLVKVVFPKLRQWCDQRRLHLVDIDLRWGVTEAEANNGKAIDICLKEIDGSRPFFICILGGRYGWVPDRRPAEERYRFRSLQGLSRSITHLEILHAVDQPLDTVDGHRGQVCPHAFFYLRRDGSIPSAEALSELTESQRRRHTDTYFEHDRPQDLIDLKQWIRARFENTRQVDEYSGRWDPTAENPEDDGAAQSNDHLIGRLTDLDEFGEQVFADLQQAIDVQFADHISSAGQSVDPLLEERALHEEFVENRTQVHIPRLEIEKQLTAYVDGDDCRPLVLSGPPGSGKSAILSHWIKESGQGSGVRAQDLLIARFIGSSPASTSLPRLLGNISQELVQHFALQEEVEVEGPGGTKTTRPQSMEVPQDPAVLESKWPKFLEAAAAKGRVLLVLDGINQLDRSADPQRLYWLLQKLPSNLRIIVSVLDHAPFVVPPSGGALKEPPESGTTNERPDWLDALRRRGLPEVQVHELNEDEQRELIRQLPSVFCKTLDDDHTRLLVENRATANPLFLIVALEELRIFGGFKTLRRRIADLPQLEKPGSGHDSFSNSLPTIDDALDSLFGQVLDRLDGEATRRGVPHLVPTLFCLLASAKQGLSERELEQLLARLLQQVDAKRRNEEMHVVLRQVRSYLMRNGPLLDFYHRSFWKAVRVKKEYLATSTDRHTAHCKLADYFQGQNYWLECTEHGQALSNTVAAGRRTVNVRKVHELPWQLHQAANCYNDGALNAESELAWQRLKGTWEEFDFIEACYDAGLRYELAQQCMHVTTETASPIRHVARELGCFLRADGIASANDATALGPDLHNWAASGVTSLLAEQWRQRNGPQTKLWLRRLNRPAVARRLAEHCTLVGHTAEIIGLSVYAPQGRLVSASCDGSVRVWDLSNGRPVSTMWGKAMLVRFRAADIAERAVTIDRTATVCLWDTATGRLMLEDQATGRYAQALPLITLDGSIFGWADSTGAIRLIPLNSVDSAIWLRIGSRPVAALFDCKGVLWIVGKDGRLWAFSSPYTGRPLVELQLESPVRGAFIAPSADGVFIWIRESGPKEPETWHQRAKVLLRSLVGGSLPARTTAGHMSVLSVSRTGDVATYATRIPSTVLSLSSSSDGRLVAAGDLFGGLTIWKSAAHGSECLARHGAHPTEVLAVAIAGELGVVATGSYDWRVRVWNLEQLMSLGDWTAPPGRAAAAQDARGPVLIAADMQHIRAWDHDGAATWSTTIHDDPIMSLTVSLDATQAVSGHASGETRFLDARTGDLAHSAQRHRTPVNELLPLSDEPLLLSVGGLLTADESDEQLQQFVAWRIASLFEHLPHYSVPVKPPSASRLLMRYRSRIGVWNLRTQSFVGWLPRVSGEVCAMADLGQGYIALGDNNGCLTVCEAHTQRAVCQFKVDGAISALAVAPAKQYLWVGIEERVVVLPLPLGSGAAHEWVLPGHPSDLLAMESSCVVALGDPHRPVYRQSVLSDDALRPCRLDVGIRTIHGRYDGADGRVTRLVGPLGVGCEVLFAGADMRRNLLLWNIRKPLPAARFQMVGGGGREVAACGLNRVIVADGTGEIYVLAIES